MKSRVLPVLLTAALSVALAGCSRETERATDSAEPSAGALLYPAGKTSEPLATRTGGTFSDPIVVHKCMLKVIDKQEVPSQREGVVRFIGTEIEPAEQVPTERRLTIEQGNETKTYRRLKEGDSVQAGQLLAQLDDSLVRDDWAIKNGKLTASKAELAAAEKTRNEAKNRYDTVLRLRSGGAGAASDEELRAAKLTWERHAFDCVSKQEAVHLAELELNQVQTLLRMHQMRSSIAGVIKSIRKEAGEAVKALEPVFQIHGRSRLRIEAQLDVEYLPRLRPGLRVVVEPARPQAPEQTFVGHLEEVTSVAVAKDARVLVSASEDGSVRVWERGRHSERQVLAHQGPVRAVACTPVTAAANRFLTGGADGSVRIWDLNTPSAQPLHTVQGLHRGAVNCVAFGPDGKTCVSGGEDREICLWDPESGAVHYRFPPAHRAAVTSVQFIAGSQLVSAGRDHTVRIWELGTTGARLLTTIDRRSGDLTHPGASADGKYLLLDQSKAVRMLTLPGRLTEGILENRAEGTSFASFACFAPDSRLIATASAADGRLQLWRPPTASTRPYELRQLVVRDHSLATCAAFAPNGSFVIAGTTDRQVLLWTLPSTMEIEAQLSGAITLIEPEVDGNERRVRLWAEVANPQGHLLPGTAVTLAIYPR